MRVVVIGKKSSQIPTIEITEAQFEELIPKAGTALDMDEIRQEIAAGAVRKSSI